MGHLGGGSWGEGMEGSSLYFLLSFSVKLKLLWKIKSINFLKWQQQGYLDYESETLWSVFKWSNSEPLSVCVCVRACLVAQLCQTLCDPMDCSPPGSSVHGISQTRILEWVAISSRGSSWLRNWTLVFCFGRWVLYHWATREAWIFISKQGKMSLWSWS